MERFYKFTVPEIKEKARIDKYITGFVQNASRTKIQKAINLGNVLVNGECVKSNYLLKPNDEIEIELPVPDKQDVLPEDIPLDIIYEDDYFLIINKPAGMVTHPAYKNYSGTLVNALMYYSSKSKGSLSDLNGFERAGIVHRLDKDTSGILVVAKDEVTHRKLADQFHKHSIDREYRAIVWGKFKNKEGIIENRISRDKKDRKKMAVIKSDDKGKLAITEYIVIEEYEFLSLVNLKLRTGRTHQIRVHLSSAGHPVFGDEMYGGRVPHSVNLTSNMKLQINNLLDLLPRQALHARLLAFINPHSGKRMEFVSDLPEDMKNIIERVKG